MDNPTTENKLKSPVKPAGASSENKSTGAPLVSPVAAAGSSSVATASSMDDWMNSSAVKNQAVAAATQNPFWTPKKIGRYYTATQSPTWQAMQTSGIAPTWLDPSALQAAYKYLQEKNTQPWYMWSDNADDDEPLKEYTSTWQTPPMPAIPTWEQANYEKTYNPANAEPVGAWTEYGLTKTQWDALGWTGLNAQSLSNEAKKALLTIFKSQRGQIGQSAFNTALMGTGFGPVGTVIGGLAGAGIGALQISEQQKAEEAAANGETYQSPWYGQLVNGVFEGLNWPFQQLQNAVGLYNQLLFSLLEPDKYGNISEILGNLKAAYQAGGGYYTALPAEAQTLLSSHAGEEGYGFERIDLTSPNNEFIQMPSGVLPAEAVMTNIRRALANGDMTPDQVQQYYSDIFGTTGEVSNIMAGFIVDPLNFLGEGATAVIGKAGKLSGNEALANAFNNAKDTQEGLRMYGQTLRQMPMEEAAKYGAVSKWVAGLNDAGELKDLQQPKTGKQNPIDYLAGLDAKSRANETLQYSVDGIKNLLVMEPDNPELQVKFIQTIANGRPIDNVDAVENSRIRVTIGGKAEEIALPRWFSSAEAQHISAAIQDQMPKVNDLLDTWKRTRAEANIVNNVASAIGSDPVALLGELHRGKVEDAAVRLRQLRDRLGQLSKDGDKNATAILNSIQGMKASDLKGIADMFVGDNAAPFLPQDFTYRMLITLGDGVDQWSAKWFNVKPANFLLRMSDAIKHAQGYMVLGNNPTYMLNNAINNIVTLAWDGLLKFNGKSARMAVLRNMGMIPTRLRSGMGAAEIGSAGLTDVESVKLGKHIYAASNADGFIQSATDLLRKGDKFQYAARASQAIERWSSEVAMLNGMKEYWNTAWTEGKGFGKMPNDLRVAMDAAVPGLSNKVTRAIQRGMSKAQIEREIFDKIDTRSLQDVLKPEEKQLLDYAPGLLNELEANIRTAKDSNGIRAAFQNANEKSAQAVHDNVMRNIETIVQKATTAAKLERTQGVLDLSDRLMMDLHDQWTTHMVKQDENAAIAQTLNQSDRSDFYRNAQREADLSWAAYENREGATWLGLYKGLGADSMTATYAQAMQHLTEIHDVRRWFFGSKRDAFDIYASELENLKALKEAGSITEADYDARSQTAWYEVNDKLNKNYTDYALSEDALQQELDNNFSRQYADQMQDPTLAQDGPQWRGAILTVRRKMVEAQAMWRNGKVPDELVKAWGDLLPDETKRAILLLNGGKPVYLVGKKQYHEVNKKFYDTIYRPFVAEMLDASNRNAPGRNRGMTQDRANIAQPSPAAPTEQNVEPAQIATEQQTTNAIETDVWRVVSERKPELAGVDENGQPVQDAKLNIIKWVRRWSQTAKDRNIKRFSEITPAVIYEALSGENAWKRAQTDIETARAETAKLQSAAFTDELTGAPNRRAFDTDLEAVKDQAHVIAFADMRGLGQTNKQLGHTVGDAYIQSLFTLANEEGIKLYRMGGDEVAAIFDTAENAESKMAALKERLRSATIEAEGKQYEGGNMHYGVGEDYAAADKAAQVSLDADPMAEVYKRKSYQLRETRSSEQQAQFGELVGDTSATTGVSPEVQAEIDRVRSENRAKELVTKKAAEMEQQRQALPQPPDGAPKEAWRVFLSEHFSERYRDQVKAENMAEALMTVTDKLAEYWGKQNGRDPSEWYEQFLLEKGGTDLGSQGLGQNAKGASYFLKSGKGVIHFFERADFSTAIHEVAHHWLTMIDDADRGVIESWLGENGYKNLEAGWEIGAETHVPEKELFARAMERYFAEGTAPKPALQAVFSKIRTWMLEIYKTITGSDIDVPISKAMREKFDQWMGAEPEIIAEPEPIQPIDRTSVWDKPSQTSSRSSGTWGWTKDQKAFISDAIIKYIDDRFSENLLQALNEKTKSKLLDAIDKEIQSNPLVMQVPEGGSLKLTSFEGINSIYYAMTGKKLAEIKSLPRTPEKGVNFSKNFLSENPENWLRYSAEAAIRLYGDPTRAADTIRRQMSQMTGNENFDTLRASKLLMVLDDLNNKDITKQQEFIQSARDNQGNLLFQSDTSDNAAVGAPLGTTDGLHEAPIEDVVYEGWTKEIGPLLANLEFRMLNEPQTGLVGSLDTALDANTQRKLRAYLGDTYTKLADTRMGAIRWGETRRDFSLLNYSKKTNFDNMLGGVFPYQFWYTHSMMNWLSRAMNKPTILSNYYRLMQMSQRTEEKDGYPNRLKGKIPIKIPFLPDWMGDTVYIDPYRQALPFLQIAAPWSEMAETANNEVRKAESNLYDMRDGDEITDDQLQEALNTRTGQAWDKALAQAKLDEDNDIRNPFDFASTMSSPLLPISLAYNVATGRADNISQLPITRLIQTATGALGIGGERGINIEGPLRRGLGLPEIDKYEDYRVDRELANMAAEGLVTSDEAQQAMLDRNGTVFDQAQQRVTQQGVVKYLGASLAADVFPEGEMKQRGLQQELAAAYEAQDAGDTEAVTKFWDTYPEYEARQLSFKSTPDEKMRYYLQSSIWDGYMNLPKAQQKVFRQTAGDNFTELFLDSETRSYDSISTDTMQLWANTLAQESGQSMPETTGDSSLPVDWINDTTAQTIQSYYDEKDRLFPDESNYQAVPAEIQPYVDSDAEYTAWNNQYLADHPEIIPYVIGESNKLYGLPQDVQAFVYQYRAQQQQLFPDIFDTQEAYYELPSNKRKSFRSAHPELENFWNWRREQAAQYPKAAPYILSEQTLAGDILGDNYQGATASYDHLPYLSQDELAQMSSGLVNQLYLMFYRNQALKTGGRAEMQDLWEAWGKPYGNLDDFIEQVVKPTIMN